VNENDKILEIYISQQQEKINELSQQLLMATTRNKYLEEQLGMSTERLKVYDNINRKKVNEVKGFNLNNNKKAKT
tara:strand:- start:8549 stop:8773 length:225 start_codon:yes stop_codon:yes gene_type:complete